MFNMHEGVSKLPQNPIFLQHLNLDCFYLVIEVGSMYLNDSFGPPRAFATWNSKLALQ